MRCCIRILGLLVPVILSTATESIGQEDQSTGWSFDYLAGLYGNTTLFDGVATITPIGCQSAVCQTLLRGSITLNTEAIIGVAIGAPLFPGRSRLTLQLLAAPWSSLLHTLIPRPLEPSALPFGQVDAAYYSGLVMFTPPPLDLSDAFSLEGRVGVGAAKLSTEGFGGSVRPTIAGAAMANAHISSLVALSLGAQHNVSWGSLTSDRASVTSCCGTRSGTVLISDLSKTAILLPIFTFALRFTP